MLNFLQFSSYDEFYAQLHICENQFSEYLQQDSDTEMTDEKNKIKKARKKIRKFNSFMNYEFYNKPEFHSQLFFCAKNRTSSAVLVNSPSKSKKKCSFSDFSD